MSAHEYVHDWREVASVTDAKARLGELVRRAEEGEILLVRRSTAVAVLISNDRWWKHLEDIEDLKDRLALMSSEPTTGDRVPFSELEPRRWARLEEPEYDVFIERACANEIQAIGGLKRLPLSKALEVLNHNPRPRFSEPIPGMAGARRYKVGNRRLVYARNGRELTVVRVGHWLVRPEEARSDTARARSAELNRKRWERLS